MTAAATTTPRIYTVCRADNREIIARTEADSDFDARMTVSRLTGWSMSLLTTQVKAADAKAEGH